MKTTETRFQFWLKLSNILVVFILILPSSYGCAVCFGAPNTPLTYAIGWAIWFLLGLVGAVFLSIFIFVGYLAYKAKQTRMNEALLKGEDWSHA